MGAITITIGAIVWGPLPILPGVCFVTIALGFSHILTPTPCILQLPGQSGVIRKEGYLGVRKLIYSRECCVSVVTGSAMRASLLRLSDLAENKTFSMVVAFKQFKGKIQASEI